MKRKVAKAERDAETVASISPVKQALGGAEAIRASHALHGAVHHALAILTPIHGRDMAHTLVGEILSSDPPEKLATTASALPVGEQPLNVRVEFTGGAAAALHTVAAMRGTSVERDIAGALANHAACWLADSNTRETPEYATLFGLDREESE